MTSAEQKPAGAVVPVSDEENKTCPGPSRCTRFRFVDTGGARWQSIGILSSPFSSASRRAVANCYYLIPSHWGGATALTREFFSLQCLALNNLLHTNC
jgi:hypothetical protein